MKRDGKAIIIECKCTGSPDPTFSWTKGSGALKANATKFDIKASKQDPYFIQILKIMVRLVDRDIFISKTLWEVDLNLLFIGLHTSWCGYIHVYRQEFRRRGKSHEHDQSVS